MAWTNADTRIMDELSWLCGSYSIAACTLLGQSIRDTHRQFCTPLMHKYPELPVQGMGEQLSEAEQV